MANPQIEDGYLRISSELWRELRKIRINGEAMQVLMFIIEKTYGFQKKEDIISISQFEKATGIQKPHVIRAIKKLIQMDIVAQKGNGVIPSYCIQKDYEKWKPLPKKVTLPKKAIGVAQKGNKPLPKKVPTKDILKDTIKDKGVLFAKEYPNAVKIVQIFLKTLDEDSRYRPKTDTKKLEWMKCAQWAINQMGKHGNEKVIDIIEYFRNPDNTDNGKFNWADNFRSLMKLKKTNSEGVTYLDYFWEELNSKEVLEYGNQKV